MTQLLVFVCERPEPWKSCLRGEMAPDIKGEGEMIK